MVDMKFLFQRNHTSKESTRWKLQYHWMITDYIICPNAGRIKEGYWVITKLSFVIKLSPTCNYCQLVSCKHGGCYWLLDASKEISVFSACKEENLFI